MLMKLYFDVNTATFQSYFYQHVFLSCEWLKCVDSGSYMFLHYICLIFHVLSLCLFSVYL